MTIRRKIINLIEDKYENDSIIILLHENNYSDTDIFEALKGTEDNALSSHGMVFCSDDVMSFDSWLNQTIDNLRNKIESNNDIFKDISKHDIISSREYVMKQNVDLSNELYHLRNYIVQLKQDKVDLQIKLERVRNCNERKNVYCYECEDNSCVNNIYYSLRKEIKK